MASGDARPDEVHPLTETNRNDGDEMFTRNIVPLEIALPDGETISVSVDETHRAMAVEILHSVFDELHQRRHISVADAKDLFSLWVESNSLCLQLKPTHRVLDVIRQWPNLLLKYSNLSTIKCHTEKPYIVVRRAALCSVEREKTVKDEICRYYLFSEACDHLLSGRLLAADDCTDDSSSECHTLAGILALLHHGAHDPAIHTPSFYRSDCDAGHFYPERLIRRLGGRGGACAALHAAHQAASDDHRLQSGKADLYLSFLQACWRLRTYGSTYFTGQVEAAAAGGGGGGAGRMRALTGAADTPVLVGVSRRAFTVLDVSSGKHPELLLCAEMGRFRSQVGCVPPDRAADRDHLPCLVLQLPPAVQSSSSPPLSPPPPVNGTSERRVVTIYSRQAALAQALVDSCLKLNARHFSRQTSVSSEHSQRSLEKQAHFLSKKLHSIAI